MNAIGKCISANPQRNGTALVAVSRKHSEVKTYGNFQAPMDPTTEDKRLTNRMDDVNYYLGTKA